MQRAIIAVSTTSSDVPRLALIVNALIVSGIHSPSSVSRTIEKTSLCDEQFKDNERLNENRMLVHDTLGEPRALHQRPKQIEVRIRRQHDVAPPPGVQALARLYKSSRDSPQLSPTPPPTIPQLSP